MFAATVVNFLCCSLSTGTEVAGFIMLIRKYLILDIDYPLSEKLGLVDNALRNMNLVIAWSEIFPVSIKLTVASCIYSYRLKIILSDLIVIWRAWALFPDRRWVVLIPFILWIGAVGE